MADRHLYEDEGIEQAQDPEARQNGVNKLFTQPYDIVVTSLIDQIKQETLHLRQVSNRPYFQRRYVWPDRLASRLIESILLNVPIPPCYLAQDKDYTLDVIDGQQRIYSIFRFIDNQFKLNGLETLSSLNKRSFHELEPTDRRKIETYTLRCVVITNDSSPEVKFDVFERLNTNTMPLNSQELRNSISRGSLINLLGKLTKYPPWLLILNRRLPDKRMRDEELILRFFAFQILGLESYSTPQKYWLNKAADMGRQFKEDRINALEISWIDTITNCLAVFKPNECFRRLPLENRTVVNRALMDLTMYSLSNKPLEFVKRDSGIIYQRYQKLLQDDEFIDLITRSIDHRSRTIQRFKIWSEQITDGLF